MKITFILIAGLYFSSAKAQMFNEKPQKYIDTIGAKLVVIDGSSIKKINGYIVHIYWSEIMMNWETGHPDELIYLDATKKEIDQIDVLKYIPLYPIPDRRLRGM